MIDLVSCLGGHLSHKSDSKQVDAVVRNDVAEEKSAPKPARRGRRRSSKTTEPQISVTTPPSEAQSGVEQQTADQGQADKVEVRARRRRRVRKSPDATKTSGSVSPASTPERESGPLVPVNIDVDSVSSPTAASADSVPSPISPQPIPEIRTHVAPSTPDAVTSRDVIEKKESTVDGRIRVKRVHSAPTDESEPKQTIEKNKEQTNTDAGRTTIEQTKGMWLKVFFKY